MSSPSRSTPPGADEVQTDLGRAWSKRYDAHTKRMHAVTRAPSTDEQVWLLVCTGSRATREYTGPLIRADHPCPTCLKTLESR